VLFHHRGAPRQSVHLAVLTRIVGTCSVLLEGPELPVSSPVDLACRSDSGGIKVEADVGKSDLE